MKSTLRKYLRCPGCRGSLTLEVGDVRQTGAPDEVHEGVLRCDQCAEVFAIRDGIPRMLCAAAPARDAATARTSARFGYLWVRGPAPLAATPSPYHFDKMARALDLPRYTGVVLDAGCGDGIDLFNHARRGDADVIGVELSDGGCATAYQRTAGLPRAHVVQADLRRLPFVDATFDAVYSYGVLHHVQSPPAAASELARVVRPDGPVAVYVYEDFETRAAALRWALRAVNSLRAITTALPPRVLYRLCQAMSPVMYFLFALPHRVLRQFRWTHALAFSLPYRHGTGPFNLTGDLYDRFSAPVEMRYSRRGAVELLANAGLQVVRDAYDRGWMVYARAARR